MLKSFHNFWRGFCYNSIMTRTLPLLFILLIGFTTFGIQGQEIKLKKGIIIDSLKVQDSIQDSFALFLPQKFELKGKWPLLVIFDMDGRGKKEMAKFTQVANQYNYILAASNSVYDSLSLTENMVRTKRLTDHLLKLLPINKSQMYTIGIHDAGRFATLVPILLKDMSGVITINSAIANIDPINEKNKFQFISIIERTNFNYPMILKDEKVLNGLKFPNSILLEESIENNFYKLLDQSISYLELLAMSKGIRSKDSALVAAFYKRDVRRIENFIKEGEYLLANRALKESIDVFRNLKDTDSLKALKKNLNRRKEYRTLKRQEEAALFKEALLQEDFVLAMEQDVFTYNYNNLGWWNYQMGQLEKFAQSDNKFEKEIGQRLKGYVNELTEFHLGMVRIQEIVDEEALVFLFMLKTIIQPNKFDNYLKVASIAAKNEDFGTALFYLEEALKNGFKSREELYSIPNTALLRITPEFNALIEKYFSEARYKIKDE